MAATKITQEQISQVESKLDFVTDRLNELIDYCEQSRDRDPEKYVEQSHFVLGVCGYMLDDAYQMLSTMRKGTFDGHPAVKAMREQFA